MKRFLIVILSLFSIAGTSFAGDTTITDGNLVFDYETPPGAPDATIQTGDYNFSGDYWYRVTFFDGTKETEMGTATSPLEDLDTDRVELTNIPTSGSLNRKIYRTKGNAYTKTAPFYYIATLDDEDTSYIDDTPDGSLNTLGPVINTTGGSNKIDTEYSLINNTLLTAVGYKAGKNGGGIGNTLVGVEAGGDAMTTGRHNVMIGYCSGASITIGSHNTAVGFKAGNSIEEGDANVLLGDSAGLKLDYGDANICLGTKTGTDLTTGDGNVIVGHNAGQSITDDDECVFIGYEAGKNETTSQKLYIDNSSTDTPLIWGDFSDGAEELIFNGDVEVTGDLTKGSGYYNAKTFRFIVGVYDETGCDHNFADDADSNPQSIQLGGTAIIPGTSRVLDAIIVCITDLSSGNMTWDAGDASLGDDYIDGKVCDDTAEIIGAKDGGFPFATLSVSA